MAFAVLAWSIESMEHADTSTQTQLSQGSTEMLDLDWAPALKTCRRNHQHTKSEIHILSLREYLFLTFIKCNRVGSTLIYCYSGKNSSIGGFFDIQSIWSFWLKRKRKKRSLICKSKKLDQGREIPSRLLWNLSCCINLDDSWANHCVEMHHEAHLDWRDLRLHLTYKFWP